mmetsp:Transcript_25180/g.77751  ORF Transcript_25180/g.77751 Transcript_25180/m.77751 type:complete len:146 (-) Transcript_25180:18-455(-)
MQVREPGRPISNLEAANLLYKSRARRTSRFGVPKDAAILEVQALYYLQHDGDFVRRDTSDAAVEAQAGVIAQLMQAGLPDAVALQLVNMPVRTASDAKLFMVFPQAEERLTPEQVQAVLSVLDAAREAAVSGQLEHRPANGNGAA